MRRLLIVALAMVLTGCSGTPGAHGGHSAATVPNGSGHNAADVMFLQMAVTHHEQGVELVRMAATRPVRAQVKDLAKAIELTQATEIDTMRDWLTDWGQPAAADPDPAAHSHHGGPAVTAPDTIAALSALPDGEFEHRFVTVLTGHQHNAVELARTELADGVDPAVRALADRVVRSRTGQIQQLLAFID
ncbi:putative lipoprotein [Alloactinosynnema sp. L-07]|uniref:DUF305 domain-containing protein n=1 Tax=Alloactinosynnema sp. L-07 TaxID=1653480 RepID=UPI00065EF460|nr:DUF305 domain-containing protein [Alloactinosynnema sp. L-07]CRK57479.1 putative lipoprotein [Alloactinosynnema sp. L-07]